MELLEIAKKRFSVRNYTNQKVEPEKLAKILEAAHVAPTAANLQPVHLIVAQSDEALAKVGEARRGLWSAAGNYRVCRPQQSMGAAL